MNSKQKNTLSSLFTNPVKKTIKWPDVEKLLTALGGEVRQGDGSRVRIILGDGSLNIHSPHPNNELKPYQVRAIRILLDNEGIKNEI